MLGPLLIVATVAGAPALSSYPAARRTGDKVILSAGQSGHIALRVALNSPPNQYAQVLVRSSGWAGLADVLPMGEIVRINDDPPSVDVVLLVSANLPTSRPKKAAIRIVVNDQDLGRTVGESTWRPTLTVGPATGLPSVSELDSDLRLARGEFNMSVAGVGPLSTAVRSGQTIVLGPDTAKWREPLVAASRIQAQLQALRAQLRAIGLTADGGSAKAAARALASNRGAPRRPGRRVFKRTSNQIALRRAGAFLIRLQFEQALGWVEALLASDRLQRAELAQALVVRGAVLAAAGIEDRARMDFGQASCLDPVARPPARSVFEDDFQRLGTPPACAKPLNTTGVSAVRLSTDEGVTLRIRVTYAPDPFSLIAGGTVQLFDAQGELLTQTRAIPDTRNNDDERSVIADFPDSGTMVDPAGQLRVAATLIGPGQVKLADLGRPEPEVVTVDDDTGLGGGGLPLWAWISIGVAVVGGATAAAVVLATSGGDSEPTRGIGPIDIRF